MTSFLNTPLSIFVTLSGAAAGWFNDGPLICGGLIQSSYDHTKLCYVIKVSISPTFYEQLFLAKVFFEALWFFGKRQLVQKLLLICWWYCVKLSVSPTFFWASLFVYYKLWLLFSWKRKLVKKATYKKCRWNLIKDGHWAQGPTMTIGRYRARAIFDSQV